jgi:hypothetical protein
VKNFIDFLVGKFGEEPFSVDKMLDVLSEQIPPEMQEPSEESIQGMELALDQQLQKVSKALLVLPRYFSLFVLPLFLPC